VLLKKAERRYQLETSDYARLAAFRQGLREFLRFSEAAATAVGLTAQQYQAMLILRSATESVTINDLARQLLLKHNSAVGLVDRLVQSALVIREASAEDRRKVQLRLSAQGRKTLAKLAAMHRRELQRIGPTLARLVREAAKAEPAE